MALLTSIEIQHLETKIAAAEKLTSAEFKIIIAKRAWFGFRKKAIRLFKKYNLHQTKQRNAVLLLILEKDQQLLIYGDEEIHQKVGNAGWEAICEEVIAEFKCGEYALGIALGLHLITDNLVEHFPALEKKTNEVSNEIIFEN